MCVSTRVCEHVCTDIPGKPGSHRTTSQLSLLSFCLGRPFRNRQFSSPLLLLCLCLLSSYLSEPLRKPERMKEKAETGALQGEHLCQLGASALAPSPSSRLCGSGRAPS